MQHLLNTRALDARIAAFELVVALVEVPGEGDTADAVAELLTDYAAVLGALRQLRIATARLEGSLQRHAGTSGTSTYSNTLSTVSPGKTRAIL